MHPCIRKRCLQSPSETAEQILSEPQKEVRKEGPPGWRGYWELCAFHLCLSRPPALQPGGILLNTWRTPHGEVRALEAVTPMTVQGTPWSRLTRPRAVIQRTHRPSLYKHALSAHLLASPSTSVSTKAE